MAREFLSDEISLMASDIQILRNENELLKMTSERKGEENRILRADLTELRAKYEEKMAETAAIRTILESVGQVISMGLTRYMDRRTLKNDHVEEQAAQPAPRPPVRERPPGAPSTVRSLVPTDRPRAPTPVNPRPEDDTPAPAFLRRNALSGMAIRTDIVDSRLPDIELHSDEDNLREMHKTLGTKEER